jgi:hypothetical protein
MPRLATETIGAGDQSWLGSTHGIYNCRSVAPDSTLFSLAAYPSGVVPSGTPIGIVTATGKAGPYTGDSTDEVQTLTEGGSGLTSYTITFGGQTTDSIDDDATAAQVQAALEALSTIGAGNVLVTGGPLASGAFTVTFRGDLANTNVAAMTTTPTGGSGTVVVATGTAGGADASADGREILAGFLYTDQKAPADGGWPLFDHGRIAVDRLPIVFAATGHNTTGQFVFVNSGGA